MPLVRKGVRKSRDFYINMFVLAHIVSWHRPEIVRHGDDVTLLTRFSGDKFWINRVKLAEQLDCKEDDITESLDWAVKIGAILKITVPNKTSDGEYIGRSTTVVPVMSRIAELSTEAPLKGVSRSPLEDPPKPPQGSPKPPQGDQNPLRGACNPNPVPNPKTKTTTNPQIERCEPGEAIAPDGADQAMPVSQSLETVDDPGAVAPDPTVVVASQGIPEGPEGNPGGAAPLSGDEPTEPEKFTDFYLDWYNLTQINGDQQCLTSLSKKETEAVKALFDGYETNAGFAALTWIEAQLLAKKTGAGGYQYLACKNSYTIPGFVRNWERTLKDIESIDNNFLCRSELECFHALRNRLLSMFIDREMVDGICCEFCPAPSPSPAAPEPVIMDERCIEEEVHTEEEKSLEDQCKKLRLRPPPPAAKDRLNKMRQMIEQEKIKAKIRAVTLPPAADEPPAPKREREVKVDGKKLSKQGITEYDQMSISEKHSLGNVIEDEPGTRAEKAQPKAPVAHQATPKPAMRKATDEDYNTAVIPTREQPQPNPDGVPAAVIAGRQGKPVSTSQ